MLEVLAAVGDRGVMGLGGGLPWPHLPGDLAAFRERTWGGAVVMGRKTWEGLPRHPLPGRLNVVVTREANLPNAKTVRTFEDALGVCLGLRTFAIGGGAIYVEALAHPECSRLWLTRVYGYSEGDVFFPPIPAGFELVSCSGVGLDGGVTYRREEWARR